MTSKIIYGEDLLAAAVPYKDYMKRMSERPAFAKVNADRKTNTDDLMAKVRAQMEKLKEAK